MSADYLSVLEISASGMRAERLRLETAALNLANANTVAAPGGGAVKPLRVVAQAVPFRDMLETNGPVPSFRVSAEVVRSDVADRRVLDPGHPLADQDGFITQPNVNPVVEMTQIMTAVRAYEANIKAVSAARAMAQRALEIGERS
jgi:flagellar basal-body rod protein FlgC